MKFSRFIFPAIVVLFLPLSLFAQSRSVDVTAFATWVDPNGSGRLGSDPGVDTGDIDFDSASGYGGAINVFWSKRVSTEFAISAEDPDVTFRANDPRLAAFTAGSLEMIPITATLQFHLSPEARFDPYIGGGVAYVLFDQLDNSNDLSNLGVDQIDFKDDYGFVANAGLSFDITPRVAINADAKYVPVKSSAKAVFATGPGQTADIDVNPFILSAGLQFQF